MRQVAVDPKRRGQGIGRALLLFAEAHAKKGGFLVMTCHARETAVSFYEKHGYQTVSHPFEEVGLPHVRMEKRLSDPFVRQMPFAVKEPVCRQARVQIQRLAMALVRGYQGDLIHIGFKAVRTVGTVRIVCALVYRVTVKSSYC